MVIKYNPKKTLRVLLFVNVVVLMFFNVLPSYTGALRFGILALVVVLLSLKKINQDRVLKWQFVFLLYVLVSSSYTYFRYTFLSPVSGILLITTLAWSLGGYLVNNKADFLRLYRVFFLCLSFISVFLLLSNFLGFGTASSVYSDSNESLKFGMSGVNIVKILALFIIVMFPLLLDKYVRKINKTSIITLFFVVAIALGFILLGFKRGSLLSLTISLIVFFIIYKRKSSIITLGAISLLFMFLFFNYFSNDFVQIKDSRMESTEMVITGESEDARLNEATMTLNTAFSNGPLGLLFGNGMFSETFYYKTRRMHHTDYFTILHGGGFIGLILFIGVYIIILIELRRVYRQSFNSNYNNAIYAAAVALISALLIQGISGTIQDIDLRMYSFVFLGATYKFLKLGGTNDNLKLLV